MAEYGSGIVHLRRMLGRAILQVNRGGLHTAARKSTKILFRNHGLFLAHKIEVGVTTGAGVDDGGEVSGNTVGSVACVPRVKRKWDFQR